MKRHTSTLLLTGLLMFTTNSFAHNEHSDVLHDAEQAGKLKLENLMSASLEGVNGTEVIVSRVSIPPNTTLPTHWHPGEEFAYVINGSAVLWQKGKDDIPVKRGDTVKVPLKQIHTAKTLNEGVVLLVFRVHEQGQPERIKAD